MKRTKAQALHSVRNRLREFVVPEFMLLLCGAWDEDAEAVLDAIQQRFGNSMIAIRSSISDEDGATVSRAGEYDSVLNVEASDRTALASAIEQVIASYSKYGRDVFREEVMVQKMVPDVVVSGVVFSHDLNNGAPYYVINYDDVSGLTNTVTSGSGDYSNRTLYIHRGAVGEVRSERFRQLLAAVSELEEVVGSTFLDVEFALDSRLRPYLLQFRPITTRNGWSPDLACRIDAELRGVQLFVRRRFSRHQVALGKSTVFGQMPDWNPAEMIGRAPRALAFSLYRRLITDNAWRIARECMGYAVPVGQPLMVSLAGQPFIDTRLSFHSYLPASLSPEIGEKLVDAWIARLREDPALHDKVEFDVAITVWTFDLENRMDVLAKCLDGRERTLFSEALRDLTQPLLAGEGGGSIQAATARLKRLSLQEMGQLSTGPEMLSAMTAQCIRYGTVPFAILARHGFIAKSLLLSLTRRGILDDASIASLQAGVRTVAGDLRVHMMKLQRGELSRAEFMRRYGHLRPGTYDILSPRYDQMDAFGQVSMASQTNSESREPFQPSPQQSRAIDALLQESPFNGIDSYGLLGYISAAIAGREYGKFVFTRSVSAMLELIAAFGESHGLSREELSHVPLEALLELGVESGGGRSVEERLREIAEANAERHNVTSAVRLPQVLFDEAGVHVIPFQVSQPNFVTNRKVSAGTVALVHYGPVSDLAGRIVLIGNADPGYDWIFGQSIAGLVTKYGGANSHMAIRCAEFGIPAAIGCGEQRFNMLASAHSIVLDCSIDLVYASH